NRVTISDVSAALGLTKGTVSRALNGYADISESTRKRVSATAQRMGYRPLSSAQSIKTGRARTLGLVIQLSEHDAHRPFLAEFLGGISETASAEDWTLSVATSNSDSDTLKKMDDLIASRKADGFILPRTKTFDERMKHLQKAGVPYVLFGRTGSAEDSAWFDISGENAMRDAVLHLAQLGHTRFAFVNGARVYNYSRLREEGFRAGMAQAGLRTDEELFAYDCVTEEDGAAAALRMLSHPNPPTAFVFAVDRAALGLYRTAAQLGLRVGDDVSVIAYDGTTAGANAEPPLSTFAVDIRGAGQQLAKMLIARINGTPPTALREVVDAQFLDRGSAGPPKTAP
ncbi:MAG: LacI family DNA-binding transcriptional regulator, partial [Pseudomonadota bacterium]